VKHATSFDRPRPCLPFEPKSPPTIEAQVVDIADEIAYDNHDLDDGITSGMIKESALNNKIGLWKDTENEINRKYPGGFDGFVQGLKNYNPDIIAVKNYYKYAIHYSIVKLIEADYSIKKIGSFFIYVKQ